MPLFSRSSFRTPKKPPRRKTDSVPNLSSLGLEDTLNFTVESTRGEVNAPAVAMKLGSYDVTFEDGQWLVCEYYTGGSSLANYESMRFILNKAQHNTTGSYSEEVGTA